MLSEIQNIGSDENWSQIIDEVLESAEGVTQITEQMIQKSNSIFQAKLMATKTEQVSMNRMIDNKLIYFTVKIFKN